MERIIINQKLEQFAQIIKRGTYIWFPGYAAQYVDLLNCLFLDMDKEKQLKSIPIMAKRLAEHGVECREFVKDIIAAAREQTTRIIKDNTMLYLVGG